MILGSLRIFVDRTSQCSANVIFLSDVLSCGCVRIDSTRCNLTHRVLVSVILFAVKDLQDSFYWCWIFQDVAMTFGSSRAVYQPSSRYVESVWSGGRGSWLVKKKVLIKRMCKILLVIIHRRTHTNLHEWTVLFGLTLMQGHLHLKASIPAIPEHCLELKSGGLCSALWKCT